MPRDPVPYSDVAKLAANIRDLQELNRKQMATQAQLIRWCVQAINQTTEEAARRLDQERIKAAAGGARTYRPVRMHEPSKKVREDKAKAILYLEYLATSLENQSVRSPDITDPPKGSLPCTEE